MCQSTTKSIREANVLETGKSLQLGGCSNTGKRWVGMDWSGGGGNGRKMTDSGDT